MDDGAKRVLIPIENKRSFFDVSAEVLENVDPIFYGEVKQGAFKAPGII
jgi:ATP-dependent Lon protease